MLARDLNLNLSRHSQEEGRFSPFNYAIGLESSIEDSEEAMQVYPIPTPISEETLSQFARSLTFFHEATHVCQFISTAYGLRTLRYTLVCLKNLSRRSGWKLPIANDLLDRLKTLSPDEMKAVEGAMIFLDGIDQLRLHKYTEEIADTGSSDMFTVDFLPWSPHFFQLNDQTSEGREEFARKLVGIGAHVRKLARLSVSNPPFALQFIINVGALMESFAVLVEMNHIHNALQLAPREVFELIPPGNEYHVLTAYMLENNLCTWGNLIPTLGVCIDAALMYDPFVLYNVPWDVVDADGRYDQYPGETFLTICDALKVTEPMTKGTVEETDRFYKELCLNAGLPDPDWMAQKSYEVASGLLAKSPNEKTLLARALRVHTDALRLRSEQGTAHFVFNLPTTGGISDLLRLALPVISFYNLNTGQPDHFDARKIDALTIHSLLLQALSQPRIDCPLKAGDPFFCSSATLPPNKLCVWKHAEGTSECLVDILEKQFGFESPE